MSINRAFWTTSFQKENIPNWVCPTCQKGILRPVKNGFQDELTAESIKGNKQPYWDFAYTNLRYSLLLECDNGNCKEHVASCGNGSVIEEMELDEKGKPYDLYISTFTPEYFSPHLLIFPISPHCPKTVREEIEASFKIFFADPSAAANHIRKSIENILTDRRIKQYSINKGERKRINLHSRIVIYQNSNKITGERLLAIKWLGNEGSHGNITRDDVLDSYEILEKVIDDLYEQHEKTIDKKVLLINKRKKPLKK